MDRLSANASDVPRNTIGLVALIELPKLISANSIVPVVELAANDKYLLDVIAPKLVTVGATV